MARHASPVQSLLVDDRFDGDVYAHEPLSRHTTYRIGGPARFFVRANSVGALTGLVDVCAAEGTPWVAVSYTHLDVYKRQRHGRHRLPRRRA